MQKSDAFTSINGRKIEKVFLSINITILIILVVLRYFFTVNIEFDSNSNGFILYEVGFISILGFIPQMLVAFIFPYQAFTRDYYAIARYYQIPLNETFKYYLSQVYSLRNLLVALVAPIICELIYFLITGTSVFDVIFTYIYSYCLSLTFVVISFLLTTYHKKWHILFKIIIPFFLYIVTVITAFTVIEVFHWWYILVVMSIDLVVACFVLLLLIRRQKRMEV